MQYAWCLLAALVVACGAGVGVVEGVIRMVPVLPSKMEKNLLKMTSMMATGGMEEGEEAGLTTPEMIARDGYPVETHHVITEDGYILELHRIPWPSDACKEKNKGPVLLQHGILGDSSYWFLSGVNQSLPYMLADSCYDVWLGNSRGNTYSRKHVKLSPAMNRKAFWNFSFHEMGIYDLPATIDYILSKTGVDAIFYIGHSMGTTSFFVLTSERPEYNEKIRLMSALSPVAYLHHVRVPIAVLIPYLKVIDRMSNAMRMYELAPSDILVKSMAISTCNKRRNSRHLCNLAFMMGTGFDAERSARGLSQKAVAHIPAGTSIKSLAHFAQIVLSRRFSQYDYFSDSKNMMEYGRRYPPDYNFTNMRAPIATYWAEDDWMIPPEDVHLTESRLPNLQRSMRVDDPAFGHMDFVMGNNAAELVHRHLIDFMDMY